jgi:hypothetical protein
MSNLRFSRVASLAVAAFLTMSQTGVHAAILSVFGNLGAIGNDPLAASTNAGISDTTWLMHGFTVGGSDTILRTVKLGLSDNDSTTARIQIFANSGGNPSGSALATQTQTVANTTPTAQIFDFGSLALTSGSSYWVVVSAPDTNSLFNWSFNDNGDFPVTQNASGWTPLSPVTKISTDSGLNWGSSGTNRPASISITAVPEPTTYAMAAAAAGLLGFAKLRRRKA